MRSVHKPLLTLWLRLAIALPLFVAAPVVAQTPNYRTTISTQNPILTGTNSPNGTSPVASARVCAKATDAQGNPISISAPTWGFIPANSPAACGSVVSGILGGLVVPDSLHTNSATPIDYVLQVQFLDTNGNPIAGETTQLPPIASITGTTWYLDTWAPSTSTPLPSSNLILTVNPGTCTSPSLYLPSAQGTGAPGFCQSGSIVPFGFLFRGAWAASTPYNVNDVFTYGGSTYIVTTQFTSGATFSSANTSVLAAAGASGSVATAPRTNSASATDAITLSDCTTAGGFVTESFAGATTVNLPVTGGFGNGCWLTVKNLTGTGGTPYTVTLSGVAAGVTIDGSSTYPLSYPGAVDIHVDGSGWKLGGGSGVRGAGSLSSPNAAVIVGAPGVAAQVPVPSTPNTSYTLTYPTNGGGAAQTPVMKPFNASAIGQMEYVVATPGTGWQTEAFGTSIVVGCCATNPVTNIADDSYGFANVAGAALGGVGWHNYARTTDTSLDESQWIMAEARPAAYSLFIGDSGLPNDASQSLPIAISQRAVQGNMNMALVPQSSKNLLQSATLSGSCALDGVTYQAGMGVNCATGGSITTSVTIDALGALQGNYIVKSGNTGSFTLAVGGTSQTDPVGGSTTWTSGYDGGVSLTTSNGATSFAAGFFLTGLTPGSQAVVVTCTGFCNFQFLDSPPAQVATNPTIIWPDVTYTANNTLPSTAQQTMLTTVVPAYAALGENAYLVGARAALGATTSASYSGGGPHYTTSGHAIVANLVLAQAATLGIPLYVQPAAGSRNAVLDTQTSNDVSQGSSFNGSNTDKAGLVTHIAIPASSGRGQALFERDELTGNLLAGHIFGSLNSNNNHYGFCQYAQAAGMFLVAATNQLNGCSFVSFQGNQAWLGYATVGGITAPALSVTPSIVNIGGGAAGQNVQVYDEAPVTNVQSNQSGSATANYPSPVFRFQANRNTASTYSCTAADLYMQIPTSGTNQSATLTISNKNPAGSNDCFGTLFALDFSTATSLNAPPTTAPSFNPSSALTTVACSTSGSATFTQPMQGSADKKVVIFLSACSGTASYTFPTAYTNTPGIFASSSVPASVASSLSTSAITITGAPNTGVLTLDGF